MSQVINFLQERYYVDEKTEPVWKKVRNHPIIEKHQITRLEVSMMATAIGFLKGLRVKGKFTYSSGGWMRHVKKAHIEKIEHKNAIAMIVSIAVKEEGLDILNEDIKVIQNIAHEYGNGGVHQLLKILNMESEDKVIGELFSLMKKASKKINS